MCMWHLSINDLFLWFICYFWFSCLCVDTVLNTFCWWFYLIHFIIHTWLWHIHILCLFPLIFFHFQNVPLLSITCKTPHSWLCVWLALSLPSSYLCFLNSGLLIFLLSHYSVTEWTRKIQRISTNLSWAPPSSSILHHINSCYWYPDTCLHYKFWYCRLSLLLSHMHTHKYAHTWTHHASSLQNEKFLLRGNCCKIICETGIFELKSLHLLIWNNSGYNNTTFSYLWKYQLALFMVNYLRTIKSQFHHVLVDSGSEINLITAFLSWIYV